MGQNECKNERLRLHWKLLRRKGANCGLNESIGAKMQFTIDLNQLHIKGLDSLVVFEIDDWYYLLNIIRAFKSSLKHKQSC